MTDHLADRSLDGLTGGLMAAFRHEAEAASSEVHEVATWSDVVGLISERAAGGRVAVTATLAAEQPELVDHLAKGGVDVVVAPEPAEVVDVAVGVVRGQLAVAESGSVLVAEPDLAHRTVAMLALRCVQVVDRARVVLSLEDAADWLAQQAPGATYATLVTGPSRTADIERSLTIGVQGPAELDVVVVG